MSYLKSIKEYALRYIKYRPMLEGYSDVKWIVDSKKSKSTN